MARVPYLSDADLPEADRPLLYPSTLPRLVLQPSASRPTSERPANLYRALANSPEALRHFSVLGRWIQRKCELPARLRELAILQVGYLTTTPYQWSHHVKIGRDVGLTDDDIRSVCAATAGQDPGLDELETLVLQATREITLNVRMSEQTWNQLLARLGVARLLDLTLIISHCNAVARVLSTLGIEVEPEFQPYLKEFPLPSG
jgi:alkylhydroperoxidase family enzyme